MGGRGGGGDCGCHLKIQNDNTHFAMLSSGICVMLGNLLMLALL